MREYYLVCENGSEFITWEHNIRKLSYLTEIQELCFITKLIPQKTLEKLNPHSKKSLYLQLKNENIFSIPCEISIIESQDKFIAITKDNKIIQNEGKNLNNSMFFRDNKEIPLKILHMFPVSEKSILLTRANTHMTRVLNIYRVLECYKIKYIISYPSIYAPIKEIHSKINSVDSIYQKLFELYGNYNTVNAAIEKLKTLC